MVDINLHKAAERELRIKKSNSILKSGSFMAFSLLAFSFLIFGATLLYQKSLERTKDSLAQIKEKEVASINKETINELVDFQERVNVTVDNLENKNNPKNSLDEIEKLIVKGVILNSLVQDGDEDTLEIDATAETFTLVASQMLSLKKSETFSDVRINSSGRDESGKIVFVLEADLKK